MSYRYQSQEELALRSLIGLEMVGIGGGSYRESTKLFAPLGTPVSMDKRRRTYMFPADLYQKLLDLDFRHQYVCRLIPPAIGMLLSGDPSQVSVLVDDILKVAALCDVPEYLECLRSCTDLKYTRIERALNLAKHAECKRMIALLDQMLIETGLPR